MQPQAIPPSIERRILAFLAAGATGSIRLNANRGRIESCEITERLNAKPTDVDTTPP